MPTKLTDLPTYPVARQSVHDAPPDLAGFEEAAGEEQSLLGLVELLLKRPAEIDVLNRDPERQRELFPRLLLIAQAGYLGFSLVMLLILNLAPADAYPRGTLLALPAASWSDGAALGLMLGYNVGLVLAACVCLPSFYFYSLLAGVRMTWLQISSILGKGMASNAMFLLGILPIYVAVVLGFIVADAPTTTLRAAILLGLLLPFVSGLWGLRAIYHGIMDLGERSQPECRARPCFLRRLTLAWAAVYTAVVPVMIYRLWELFTDLVRGT